MFSLPPSLPPSLSLSLALVCVCVRMCSSELGWKTMTLTTQCSIHEIKRSDACDAAVDEVVQTLGGKGVGVKVQSYALRVLSLFCQGSREVRALVISCGVVKRTILAMKLARFAPQITARAFALILVLAAEPHVRRDLVQYGGGTALIIGLKHITNDWAVGLALRALAFLVPQVQ